MKKSIFALILLVALTIFSSNYLNIRNVFASTSAGSDSLDLKPDNIFPEEDQLIQSIISRYH